ncbi:MAG: glucose-1-phosphate thymidylyltransferase RfbA [Candidatus Omnitrophica bacterium]|nr:glucose-1-phosphate thymidylyltransferase RfbA [Candidatus Omnitrophota bacterium]MDD5488840.1 glucose-1-phosphate thymidylyltransferase RfbA [Candidatus Omnitrophota bacterium]
MKGIILAGGTATRLYPITKGVCKQMLPVYDKPLIYYPLSVLMLAGIRDILIISTPKDTPRFQDLLGDGSGLGVSLRYLVQETPNGIADAFRLGADFIGEDSVSLILGDNIFYGPGLPAILQRAAGIKKGALIFACYVKDPERYGVVELDDMNKVVSIEEKPRMPKSCWAVSGLYFYDNQVVRMARDLKPSPRGELEITDINNIYARKDELAVEFLRRGYAWLDTGTYDSLIDASVFIKTIEDRQGLKIGCIEEVAYRMGYITRKNLEETARGINTGYGEYLMRVAGEEVGRAV